jgi:hypothetical protein
VARRWPVFVQVGKNRAVRQCREPANFLATGLAVSGRERTCDGRASLVKPFQVTSGADVRDVGGNWEGCRMTPEAKKPATALPDGPGI